MTLTLATPYGSIRRGKLRANAAEVAAIARKEGAGGLVVGLPLSMDGTVGPAAQAARDWTLALSEATGLPAALWDERLSSAAVNRFLIEEVDLSRKKRADVVDRMAAAWLLQAALDASRSCSVFLLPPPPASGEGIIWALLACRRRGRRREIRAAHAPVPPNLAHLVARALWRHCRSRRTHPGGSA